MKKELLKWMIFAIFAVIPFNIERNILGAWVTSSDLMILAALAVWLFFLVGEKNETRELTFPLWPFIAGLAGMFLISFSNAPAPFLVFKETVKYIALFCFFYFLVNNITLRSLNVIAAIIALTSFLLSFWLIYDYVFSGQMARMMYLKTWTREILGTHQLNGIGVCLAAAIPLTLYFLSAKITTLFRLAAAAGLLTQIVALYLTFSRGSWIAVFIVLVIYFIYGFKVKRAAFILLILLVPFILINGFFPHLLLKERFYSTFDTTRGSIIPRKEHLAAALMLIRKEPLTGVGLGNYQTAAKQYLNMDVTEIVHNIFLQFAAESGIISMILLILLIARYYSDLIGMIKKRVDKELPFYILLCFTALLTSGGLFGDPFIRNIKEYFILFLAIPYALKRGAEKEFVTDK